MNKHVVSFLSLFSLVLVLGIYYVVMPLANENALEVNSVLNNNEELVLNDASNLFFTTLEENRKNRHEEVKEAQLDILASSEYSNEEKLEAKNVYDFEIVIEETEVSLEKHLDELEYNDIFVEKLDNYFYITAYDDTLEESEDTSKVISIMDLYHQYFNSNDVEVLSSLKPVINFVSF